MRTERILRTQHVLYDSTAHILPAQHTVYSDRTVYYANTAYSAYSAKKTHFAYSSSTLRAQTHFVSTTYSVIEANSMTTLYSVHPEICTAHGASTIQPAPPASKALSPLPLSSHAEHPLFTLHTCTVMVSYH